MFFEHLGTYISLFFRLAYTHQVKLDHNFVCVAMAIKVMEGLAIALNPSLGAPTALNSAAKPVGHTRHKHISIVFAVCLCTMWLKSFRSYAVVVAAVAASCGLQT